MTFDIFDGLHGYSSIINISVVCSKMSVRRYQFIADFVGTNKTIRVKTLATRNSADS